MNTAMIAAPSSILHLLPSPLFSPLFALGELNHPYLGLLFLIGVIVAILLCNPPPGAKRYVRSPHGYVPAYWWPLILCGGMMGLLGLLFGAGLAARL